jgi:hypothetical protein
LDTAVADFHDFLGSLGARPGGQCPVRLVRGATSVFEEYAITVRAGGITVSAGDTEGIRRGLIHLEDMILSRGNFALPLGTTRRRPVIRTRLSRCFYGPINRPPKCRDELLDRRNYYPNGYLNRLAHHGINALWLTISFRDLCRSRIFPEHGRDAGPRLRKLRDIVRRCARYGIRVYPFCIEPAALPSDSPVFRRHPELKGADAIGGRSLFCTSSRTGQAYLEEAARFLFSEVPGLGGLMCIPVGERFTHCCSGVLGEGPEMAAAMNCPRCSRRKPWEVLGDTLAALKRGMASADPSAELVAWPYSQVHCWGRARTVESAAHFPRDVILQHNFESGGRVRQHGKWRPLWDYWLSWVGPSALFADCARAARKGGARVFAKLQTSCSHEVATTQYVPAPGLIYRKYRKLHALGVSGVTLGWYFGNYPSVMTMASRQMSFAPPPKGERAFLEGLARRDWGRDAPRVARAWRHFQRGYTQYPGTKLFGYYGPMHDGVVWPLWLEPRHLPLSPTWRIAHPPSGDQVAECFAPDFHLGEILALCGRMRDEWLEGVAILRGLARRRRLDRARREQVNVARALGIQFASGCNVLRFYLLRDRLADARGRRRLTLLARLRDLVLGEIAHSREMLGLCRENPCLGFHSEAEGFKYHPRLLRWRMRQLRRLLRVEFPKVRKHAGLPSFGNYVGRGNTLQACRCEPLGRRAAMAVDPFHRAWDAVPAEWCRHWAAPRPGDARRPFPFNSTLHPVPARRAPAPRLAWRAVHGREGLVFCLELVDRGGAAAGREELRVVFEPLRLGPWVAFAIGRDGQVTPSGGFLGQAGRDWTARSAVRGRRARMLFAVSWGALGLRAPGGSRGLRLRVNVQRWFSPIADPLRVTGKPMLNSWAPTRRTMPRNIHGYLDPAGYGWLVGA